MSTLENSKLYQLQERTQALVDLSRTRLNGATPHQAPQRERVTLAALPASAQERRASRRRQHKNWKDQLSPDINMGVPSLMLILEPNIVWEHTHAYNSAVGSEVEAHYCPGDYFDGWHRGGRPAHGVYEGSYWELLGNCDALVDMLRKMSRAPPLEELPQLQLPDTAELPKWEDFKPALQPLPSEPTLPTLRLPVFRVPILDTEVPFLEPDYLELPDVPDMAREERLPIFFPPELMVQEPFDEPEFIAPEPPTITAAPQAPVFGKPQYGHDWTGSRPFTVELQPYVRPKQLEVPRWVHPPRRLPKLPLADELQLDQAELELEPIPKLELAWACGPDPEPAFASISTTPRTLSRASSPQHSRPVSAGMAPSPGWRYPSPPPSRPTSALHTSPPAALPPGSRPTSARPASGSGLPPLATPGQRMSASGSSPTPPLAPGTSGRASPSPGTPDPAPLVAASPPATHASLMRPLSPDRISRPSTATPRYSSSSGSRSTSNTRPGSAQGPGQRSLPSPQAVRPSAAGGQQSLPSSPGDPQQAAWEGVAGVEAGRPCLWLNFNKPFAELPPVFIPPRPEMGVSNGPEPQPQDYPVGELEQLPEFVMPTELHAPSWEPPTLKTPQWVFPCEPRPIGFMRGTAPVLILDVSGTMNPRQRGKFNSMKDCACELLQPQGELATAASAFDVIAFSAAAYAWSATFSQRLSLLSSSQLFYTGRQAGGKITAGSRAPEKTRAGAQMMPTEPDLLDDARKWVENWPDATGQTTLLSAFLLADEHWNADCWYLMSDGRAHDPMQCIAFLEDRIKHQQRVPIIHTVGFFTDEASPEGRQFLQQLATLTGGTFQEYRPTLNRIYKEGQGFVKYDTKAESVETCTERKWAEEVLRGERKKNIRLGIQEPLDVTIARVQALHNQLRVQPLVREHTERVAGEQAAYEAELAKVVAHNTDLKARALREYQQLVDAVTARNQAKVDHAKQRYEQAHAEWETSYRVALADWEKYKTSLEAEREEAIAALQALERRRSRTPSPPRSRPGSARQSAGQSRPSSARTRPPSAPSTGAASLPMSSSLLRSRPSSALPMPRVPEIPENLTSGSTTTLPLGTQPSAAPAEAAAVPSGLPPRSLSAASSANATPVKSGIPSMSSPASRPTSASPSLYTTLSGRRRSSSGATPLTAGQPAAPLTPVQAAGTRSGSRSGSGSRISSANNSTSAHTPPGKVVAEGSSRPASARTQSANVSERPSSAGRRSGTSAGRPLVNTSARPSSARPGGAAAASSSLPHRAAGVSSAAVASSLQLLLEEGEEEVVEVEGEPSGLSLTPQASCTQLRSSSQPSSAPALGSTAQGKLQEHEGEEEQDGGDVFEEVEMEGGGSELPELELEDSQELKRRIHPPEVVKDLDVSNAGRLDEIRGEWARLLSDVEQRNRHKLDILARNQDKIDAYVAEVVGVYADSYVREALFGAATRIAANKQRTEAAEAEYAAQEAFTTAENARLAQAHAAEVEDKVFREEQFRLARERWERGKTEAWKEHEAAVTAAKAHYAENVAQLRAEWQQQKEEVQRVNAVRMAEAEAYHACQVEEVMQVNKRHKQEYLDKIKERKAVEAENLGRLAEARTAHNAKLSALSRDNDERLRMVQQEHAALCERLSVEHEEACEVAQHEFEELKAFLTAHNDSLTDEARKKYAEAVASAQADFAAQCDALRASHALELERVRQHNEAIWPQVQVARLAQAELARVQAFAEHIRYCANKLQLGVNFMPNTPNYDRVVEMQALTEALVKAFPELPPHAYPWPGHDQRLTVGTGWTAAPAAKSLTIPDPTADIKRIAAGLPLRPASAQRPHSAHPSLARPTSAITPRKPSASPHPELGGVERGGSQGSAEPPLSLARPRFAAFNAGSSEVIGPGLATHTVTVPTTKAQLQQLSASPPGAARGRLPSMPSSAEPAPEDVTAAAGGYSVRQAGGQAVGGSLATMQPVTSATAKGQGHSHSAHRAHSAGAAPSPWASPVQASPNALGYRPRSPTGKPVPRPVSARTPVPARMSADLANLQGTLTRFRSAKVFAGAPQGGSPASKPASGFKSETGVRVQIAPPSPV